jgi:hypothetical protein
VQDTDGAPVPKALIWVKTASGEALWQILESEEEVFLPEGKAEVMVSSNGRHASQELSIGNGKEAVHVFALARQ